MKCKLLTDNIKYKISLDFIVIITISTIQVDLAYSTISLLISMIYMIIIHMVFTV